MALNPPASNVPPAVRILTAHFHGEHPGPVFTDPDDIAAIVAESRALADAMAARLAGLRQSTYDRTLDDLPLRDIGHPGPDLDWAAAIDQLKHASRQPAAVDQCPTMARSLLGVTAALVEACATELDQPPAAVADLLTWATPLS